MTVLRMMAVFDIPRDGIHRPRAVQGNHRDQILQTLRPELHHHAAASRRIQTGIPRPCCPCDSMANTFGSSNAIFINLKIRDFACGSSPARRGSQSEIPQAQKVHFQKAQLFQGGHGVLRDDRHHRFLRAAHTRSPARSVMTTPAAWVEALRGIPSSFRAISISSWTWGSVSYRCFAAPARPSAPVPA